MAVIVGTRPEDIKLAPVIQQLQASKQLQPLIVSTSQHGEMVGQIFSNFGITADLDLEVMRPRQSLWDLSAILSTELGKLFSTTQINAVLVQGDTTSAFIGGFVPSTIKSHLDMWRQVFVPTTGIPPFPRS